MPGDFDETGEVDLKELLRDGARALVVEPPPGSVRENAPAEPAVGQVVDPPEIAEHLGGRRGLLPDPSRSAVEGAEPPLRLDDRKAELVTPPPLGNAVGAVLLGLSGEQQPVGHILAAPSAEVLLPQGRGPTEPRQNRPDQVVLRLALVGRPGRRKAVEYVPDAGLEAVERGPVDGFPFGLPRDGLAQEIVSEQGPLERRGGAHAAATPGQDGRPRTCFTARLLAPGRRQSVCGADVSCACPKAGRSPRQPASIELPCLHPSDVASDWIASDVSRKVAAP